MAHYLTRPKSIGTVIAAFAYTALTFGALTAPTAAEARTGTAFYTVKLAQPVNERSTTIAGGVAWACSGSTCVAQKSNSRPLRVCRELQRQHGEVVSFVSDEKELDADGLAKCNA